jgi:hypothetical protein
MAGTGYTSVGDYLSANQGTLDREKGALQHYVGQEYGQAQGAADDLIKSAVPGSGDYTQTAGYGAGADKATKAQQDQTGLNTYGGVADLLKRIYGGSSEGASFDAGLLGPQGASKQPNLVDYLNQGLAFNSRDATPSGSGSSDARHNRPHGPANQPPPDPGADYTNYKPDPDPYPKSDPVPPNPDLPNFAPAQDRPEDWERRFGWGRGSA